MNHHLHSGHHHLHRHHLDHHLHHHRHHHLDHERGFMTAHSGGIGGTGGLLGLADDTGGMAMSLGLGLGHDDHTDGGGVDGGLHPWWCRKGSNGDPGGDHSPVDLHNQHHHHHHQQHGYDHLHHHDMSLPKQRPAHLMDSGGIITPTNGNSGGGGSANPQVWIWLKTVHTPPTPEPMPMFPPSASIENYYTNTDTNDGGKVTEVVYEEIAGIG